MEGGGGQKRPLMHVALSCRNKLKKESFFESVLEFLILIACGSSRCSDEPAYSLIENKDIDEGLS